MQRQRLPFRPVRQILPRLAVEGRCRHDHACGAEAALKGLRIEEGLLHRVELAVAGEPFDGGDLVPGAAEGGHQAGMERHAVEPDGAGAAVALVAAFLDAEEAELAQEGSEALTGRRLRREGPAVHGEIHAEAPGLASSARICSA